MKVNGYLFALLAFFLGVTAIVYWDLSKDPTGATCIAVSGGLATLIGFYLLFTARRMDVRPEDRGDGEIAEGAGLIGHFSPASWWPVLIAGSVVPLIFGIIYGLWLTVIGFAFLMAAVIGLLFEHYTGSTARDW